MSDNNDLSPRVAIQIRLALSGEGKSGKASASLLRRAKRAGLTDAQVDAALSGRSFEAKACAAIRLARAIASKNAGDLSFARAHAAAFGLCPAEIAQVEQLAARLLDSRPDES